MPKVTPLAFDVLCRFNNLPEPVPEYRFAIDEGRQWRFDWAWPSEHVALEIEGGAFVPGGGRHTRGDGFRRDIEKYNNAGVRGWIVLRALPEDVGSQWLFDTIRRALARTITIDPAEAP